MEIDEKGSHLLLGAFVAVFPWIVILSTMEYLKRYPDVIDPMSLAGLAILSCLAVVCGGCRLLQKNTRLMLTVLAIHLFGWFCLAISWPTLSEPL